MEAARPARRRARRVDPVEDPFALEMPGRVGERLEAVARGLEARSDELVGYMLDAFARIPEYAAIDDDTI